MKKISIVVPAYNIERHIKTCIQSILAQEYDNLEIIIVDDGSTDGTGDIVDKIAEKDSRIVVIHQENGGVTGARLAGIRKASGDYIGFVDGDDYIDPDMFKRLIDNAERHNADISHCGYKMVFPSRTDYYYNTGTILTQDRIKGLSDLLYGDFIEPGLVNKIFKSELFDGLEEWMDKSIKINEDLLMNYYLFNKASVSFYEDFCPYHYMVRKGSAANSPLNEHKLKDPLKVTGIIYEDSKECFELLPAIQTRAIRLMIMFATISDKCNPSLIKPYRKFVRKKLRKVCCSDLFRLRIGMRLKIMALWAAVWPSGYSFVHNIHSKLNGNDKKYEIS